MEAEFAESTVFAAYEQVKATVGSKKVLKIFLIDNSGKKHIAAIGEDLGDAHYHYHSSKPFAKYGLLDCHNRKELIVWLEQIISESGGAQGAHLMADEANPEGVYFTQHSFERAHYPDGRRCSRWYLTDQHGNRHLAVIGIERDTKDGHYNYVAEEPFASIKPLHCSNQSGVYKWLENMITHHPGDTDYAPQSKGAGANSDERSGPLVINLSALRSARMSAAALKSLEKAVVVDGFQRTKPKERKSSGAPPQPLKQKQVGIVQQIQLKKVKKMQEDIIAEEQKLQTNHLAKLRRAAAAEVAGDTAAKACTLGWLHGSLAVEDEEHLEHWIGVLTTVLDLQQQQQQGQHQGDGAGVGGASAEQQLQAAVSADEFMQWVRQPENFRHHLRILLECLKELAAADLPGRVLLSHKVIPVVQRCVDHPHKAVAGMAQHMLDRWRWQLAGHMHVLSCPTYMEDHLAAVEEEIANGLVPLPQLPKHKQAILNNALPRPPVAPGFQTPAPPGKYGSQQLQLLVPASAPAGLGAPPGSAAGPAGQHTALAAYTPATAGFTLTPATDLQTPGFYTPVIAGGLAAGAVGNDALGGAPGIQGTGAVMPGFIGATTGPRGGLVFGNALSGAAGALAAGSLPSAGPISAVGPGGAAGLPYSQPGVGMGFVDPAAAAYSTGGLSGWSVANGIYDATGQLQQQVSGDGSAEAVANAAGGDTADFGVLQQVANGIQASAPGDGAVQQAAQQQQLAMQLQYQQQLRAQMILMGQQQAAAAAGPGSVQIVGGLQQQSAGPSAPTADQQQQWLLWQQTQPQMVWAASQSADQPMQDAGSQGLLQQ